MAGTPLFSISIRPIPPRSPGCGRADAYPMLKVISALTPGVIHLPEINGKPSMKLGPVLRADGIDDLSEDEADAGALPGNRQLHVADGRFKRWSLS